MDNKREIWLDWLRVVACFLVMLTHSTEPFYLGGKGSLILTHSDAVWAAVMDVLSRAAVVLFIIASSYLQFPLHYSTKEFFRKRALRILPPFILWSIVYALVWGSPVQNFKDLLWNFNYAAGHLWFVYMLLGLYLIMPVLSPWVRKASRKELSLYLVLWALTLFIPTVRDWAGGMAPIIYAHDGLPAPALFPLWGEACWNPFGLFYYLSGFVGYLLLGKVGHGDVKVENADVDAAIASLLANNASLVIKEDAAKEGDTVVIDFLGKINGEAFEGGSSQNYELELGSHSFIPGFEEQLVGHKAGEHVDVKVTFPENYVENLKGKEAVFECDIHEVKEKKLPELNDEFVKELNIKGVETVEQLKANKRSEIEQNKKQEERREYVGKLLDEIVKGSEIDIADEIIDNQVESRKEDMEKRMGQSGLNLKQYLEIIGQTEEQFTENLKKDARKDVERYVVVEEIGKAEKFEIEDADVEFELARLADQYNMKIEDVRKAIAGQLDQFKNEILNRRIEEFLVNNND